MWKGSSEKEEGFSKKNARWLLGIVLILLIFYRAYPKFVDRFFPTKNPKIVETGQKQHNLNLVPAGSLLDDYASYTFAVYHISKPLDDPKELLTDLIKSKFTKFSLVEKQRQNALIMFDSPEIKKFPPPDLESLKYFVRGLTEEEKGKLQESQYVSVLNFRSPVKENSERLREAYEITEMLAEKTGGYLWDEMTRECFTLEDWRVRRQDGWDGNVPDVPRHVMIHFYNTDEYYREITLGMAKFGLPDVVVNDFPKYYSDSIKDVINLTCQRMTESPRVTEAGVFVVSIDDLQNNRMKKSLQDSLMKGAKGYGKFSVTIGTHEEGNPDNRLLEISFPAKPKLSAQAQQAVLITTIFGGEDEVSYVDHDEEILAASKRAIAKLPELQKLFEKGLPPDEHILLKVPFKMHDGENEWMWVEVVSWKKDKVEGILVNQPYHVPDLVEGDRVEFNQDVAFDYIHEFPDGHSEGNETGKILASREKK